MNQLVRFILSNRVRSPDVPVFHDFDRSNFAKRRFKPACEKAEVRVIRFHDLRHTFGSHLAMRGVSLFKIRELMGHSDIKVTMRYMHLAPNELQGITDVLMPKIPSQPQTKVFHLPSRN